MAQAQGSKGIISIQLEEAFGVAPTTPNMEKVYFSSEGFKSSRNLIASDIITGNRHSAIPLQGNIDVQGSIATELGTNIGKLLYGATGMYFTALASGANEVPANPGGALTAASGVVSNGILTLTLSSATAHGYAVGDIVALGNAATIGGASVTVVRFTVVTSSWAAGTGVLTLRGAYDLTGAVVVIDGGL